MRIKNNWRKMEQILLVVTLFLTVFIALGVYDNNAHLIDTGVELSTMMSELSGSITGAAIGLPVEGSIGLPIEEVELPVEEQPDDEIISKEMDSDISIPEIPAVPEPSIVPEVPEEVEPIVSEPEEENIISQVADKGIGGGMLGIQEAPVVSSLVLNASDDSNNTNENLTAWWTTTDADSDDAKNITNWLLNGSSIAVLNMPFEKVSDSVINATKDYSGRDNNGSEIAGITWNASGGYDSKGAFEFDGSNDHILVPTDSSLNFGSGSFTISLWIKFLDCDQFDTLIEKRIGNDHGWKIDIGTADCKFRILLENESGTGKTFNSDSAWNDGAWHHFVVTADTSSTTGLKMYIDNSVQSTTRDLTNYGSISNNDDILIGKHTNYYLNGTLDDIILFNRSLSAKQVEALYNNRTDLIVSQETSLEDVWSVEVTPNDGTSDGTTQTSTSLTILLNSTPTVTTPTIAPATAYTSDTLEINTTYDDPDDDLGTIYFEWYKNGTNIYNQTNSSIADGTTVFSYLDGNNFSKDDLINVSVYANDGTNNSSTVWSSNTLTIQNLAPETAEVVINATSVNNYTTDNLTCYANITDTDGDSVYANYTWYNSSEPVLSGQSGAFTESTLTLIANLSSTNTTKDENWTCEVQAYDGTDYEGSWTNSTTNVTILNTPPQTAEVLINTTAVNNYTTDNLTCYANITDNDSDTVYANYTWYNSSEAVLSGQSGAFTESTLTLIANLSSANTTKDENWTCEVQAYDGTDYEGSWTNSTTNVTILNTAPTFDTDLVNKSITSGQAFSYDIDCSDNDSDTITYYDDTSLFNINSATGIISHTPTAAQAGAPTINISCSDGDVNTSQTFIYTITAAATEESTTVSTPGSGAAGSGAVGDTAGHYSKLFDFVEKGQPTTLEFGKTKEIQKIEFSVSENLETDWIEVKKVTAAPKEFSGTSISIFKISAGKIKNKLEEASIYFSVDKNELIANSMDQYEVALFHLKYNTYWEELPTKLTGADEKSFYYVAKTDQFSYFLIGKKETAEIEGAQVVEKEAERSFFDQAVETLVVVEELMKQATSLNISIPFVEEKLAEAQAAYFQEDYEKAYLLAQEAMTQLEEILSTVELPAEEKSKLEKTVALLREHTNKIALVGKPYFQKAITVAKDYSAYWIAGVIVIIFTILITFCLIKIIKRKSSKSPKIPDKIKKAKEKVVMKKRLIKKIKNKNK